MANLISPGVSVTITDESFFIPASAVTIPLLFIATADEKTRPDGITAAAGTYEHSVVRTVTSLRQSTELYGIPRFLEDTNGKQLHGDARNEYGVFALNQFLGIGNLAYAVRANVNLRDDITTIRQSWDNAFIEASFVFENLANTYLSQYNETNGFAPSVVDVISSHGPITAGTGYTAGLYTNVSLTGGTGVNAKANITVGAAGRIATLNTLVGGASYTAGVYTAVPLTGGTPGSGATANITVGTTTGSISTTGTIVPGTLYTSGTYTNVPLTGGAGAGAQATIIVAGGAVTSVNITAGGLGYIVGNTLSASAVNIGGTGSGFSVPVATLAYAGSTVTAVTVVAGGTGYLVGGTLSAAASNIGGTGSGFSIKVATTNYVGTTVTSVNITAGGTGYAIGNVLGATSLAGGTGFAVSVTATTGYKVTINRTTFMALATQAVAPIWNKFSFRTLQDEFINDQTLSPLPVFANGYNNVSTSTYIGLAGIALDWVANLDGSVVDTEWTPIEAGNTLEGASDKLKYTLPFLYQTSLGANDAARRLSIVTALQAAINSNTDIRSEQYEYNLVLCPGFHECADELVNLVVDVQEEAFAIIDTPMTLDPDAVVAWAGTSARQQNRNAAYYYPHALASNLDGKNVVAAASGVALRTITYSDEVSELWFAPAGTRRGVVTGVTQVGYISGTLGSPTTFNEISLSTGQKNNLYKYFTNINPIAFIPGRGILIMGQKTSSPDASALDRINVVRMLAYIKRQLRKNSLPFVFQPNDQLTRDSLKAAVDGFLGDLIVKRGLYDFATVCDESNNDPARIDRNEMYIDVALKPVKAAEFIYIPIRVVNTGTDI